MRNFRSQTFDKKNQNKIKENEISGWRKHHHELFIVLEPYRMFIQARFQFSSFFFYRTTPHPFIFFSLEEKSSIIMKGQQMEPFSHQFRRKWRFGRLQGRGVTPNGAIGMKIIRKNKNNKKWKEIFYQSNCKFRVNDIFFWRVCVCSKIHFRINCKMWWTTANFISFASFFIQPLWVFSMHMHYLYFETFNRFCPSDLSCCH